jgi:hypothetical protein
VKIERYGNTVDVEALQQSVTDTRKAYQTEKATIEAAVEYQRVARQDPGRAQGRLETFKEYAGIDWNRLLALKDATPAEIRAAQSRLDMLGLTLNITAVASEAKEPAFARFDPANPKALAAHNEDHYRRQLLTNIDKVRQGLAAAGECAAVANFPMASLDAIEAIAKKDLEVLPKASDAFSAAKSWWQPGPPTLDQLPASRVLAPNDFATAAREIGRLLDNPRLEADLAVAAGKLGAADRAAFERDVQSYARLADEALAAPDYARNPRMMAEDRATYRARKFGTTNRNQESKRLLGGALQPVLADPRSLGSVLVREFLREVGVPADVSRGWRGTPEAVGEALAGEALVPLRAANEQIPENARYTRFVPLETTRALAQDITRAVVEGRYENWRAETPEGRQQLALLTPEQRVLWLGPGVSAKLEIDGATLSTHNVRGFERFWATKVGGPSHGFDSFASQCWLALATNPRNDIIAVDDPRWGNVASRSYSRVLRNETMGHTCMMLEGTQTDFPYRRFGLESAMEAAVLKHAIVQAQQLGLPLELTSFWNAAINKLGLEGQWRSSTYVLEPSVLIEAGDAVGVGHDRVQRERFEFRGERFIVDLKRLPDALK